MSLSLVHPKMIRKINKHMSLDIFQNDESLVEFLGVYDNFPTYHHDCGFYYYLNIES